MWIFICSVVVLRFLPLLCLLFSVKKHFYENLAKLSKFKTSYSKKFLGHWLTPATCCARQVLEGNNKFATIVRRYVVNRHACGCVEGGRGVPVSSIQWQWQWQ